VIRSARLRRCAACPQSHWARRVLPGPGSSGQGYGIPPSFWSNALVTMLILLGPEIEDRANGKDVFVGVALYAWGTVWALERWRASRSEAFFKHSRI
jgi:hypothetical protein